MHNKWQIKQHKILKPVTATPEVTKKYKKDARNETKTIYFQTYVILILCDTSMFSFTLETYV